MSIEQVFELLDKDDEVLESYILVREMKVLLRLGHPHFHPTIQIKIYRSNVVQSQPYHFEVSHYVHTPSQASPYMTSRTFAESEGEAIRRAISATTSFLKAAIREGKEPSESWLVPNEDF